MTLPLPHFFEAPNNEPSERIKLIQALGEIRQEWQNLTEGEDLTSICAPVGLLLSDIANKLELSPQECYVVLGSKLTAEVNRFVKTKVSPK